MVSQTNSSSAVTHHVREAFQTPSSDQPCQLTGSHRTKDRQGGPVDNAEASSENEGQGASLGSGSQTFVCHSALIAGGLWVSAGLEHIV